VLASAGFTGAGVAAGSLAAGVQSAVYGGAATGVFATLQSAGVAGLGFVSKLVVGSTTTVGASSAMDYMCKCECEEQ